MTAEERFCDDAILRRVAAARPAMREEDLSPAGERALAIADRVLGTQRPPARRGPRAWTRGPDQGRRRPGAVRTPALAAAAVCIVAIIVVTGFRSSSSGGQAEADAVHIRLTRAAAESRATLRAMARTPLGVQIERGHLAVQEDIQTGTVAENRMAIAQLTRNATLCERAAAAVRAAHARPGQRALQRYWVLGTRLQATGDRELASALRAFDAGETATGRRTLAAALDALDRGDGYTGWAENGLSGNPGPLPHGR